MYLVVPVPTSFSIFIVTELLPETVNAPHSCYPLQFIGSEKKVVFRLRNEHYRCLLYLSFAGKIDSDTIFAPALI
jgi:hypothetical protein